jgi:hypothetical protein
MGRNSYDRRIIFGGKQTLKSSSQKTALFSIAQLKSCFDLSILSKDTLLEHIYSTCSTN